MTSRQFRRVYSRHKDITAVAVTCGGAGAGAGGVGEPGFNAATPCTAHSVSGPALTTGCLFVWQRGRQF